MHLGQGAADLFLELGLDLVGVLEADIPGYLGDDVGVNAMVAVAELDIHRTQDLRVRGNDLTHATRQMRAARGDIVTAHDMRFHRLEVNVYARRVRQLGAKGALQTGARA